MTRHTGAMLRQLATIRWYGKSDSIMALCATKQQHRVVRTEEDSGFTRLVAVKNRLPAVEAVVEMLAHRSNVDVLRFGLSNHVNVCRILASALTSKQDAVVRQSLLMHSAMVFI